MSASGNYTDGFRRAYKTASDLTGKFGYAVRISADNTVDLAVNGDQFIGTVFMEGQGGVPGNAPTPALHTTYRFTTIQMTGVVPAISGAAITAGQELTVNAASKFVPAVAGQTVVGVAEENVAAADLRFSMLIRPRGAAA